MGNLLSPFWFSAGGSPPPSGDLYDWNTAPTGDMVGRPLYTALDLDDIYFHASAGDWGAQETLVKPDPPVLTSAAVTVHDNIDWDAAVDDGAHIVIAADFSGTSVSCGTFSDIMIEIEDGAVVGGSIIMAACHRIFVGGETPGATGTGKVNGWGALCGGAGACTSIVVDGITMEGGGYYSESNSTSGALLRCLVKDGDVGYWPTDFVCAETNIYSSIGWCVRFNNAYRRCAFKSSRFLSSSNAAVRIHPTQPPQGEAGAVWVDDCHLGNDTVEGVWKVDYSTVPQDTPIESCVIQNCLLYSNGPTMEASPGANDVVTYYRMLDCTIYVTDADWSPAGTTGPDWAITGTTVLDADGYTWAWGATGNPTLL